MKCLNILHFVLLKLSAADVWYVKKVRFIDVLVVRACSVNGDNRLDDVSSVVDSDVVGVSYLLK